MSHVKLVLDLSSTAFRVNTTMTSHVSALQPTAQFLGEGLGLHPRSTAQCRQEPGEKHRLNILSQKRPQGSWKLSTFNVQSRLISPPPSCPLAEIIADDGCTFDWHANYFGSRKDKLTSN